MPDLTPRQLLFIDEYFKDLNGKQAAIRAGYSEKTAQEQSSRLLSNVKVKAKISEKQAKIAKKNGLTHDWVIKNLKKVYKRCMQDIPVLDHEGSPTGEYKFEHSGANKSLELIGKHLGTFSDRVQVTGKDGEAIEVKSLVTIYIPDNGRDAGD